MTPFEKIVEVLKAQTSEMEAEGRALRQFLRTSGSPEWVDLQKAGEAGTVECDHLVLIAAAITGTAGMRFLMHWLQQRPLNEESARCILGTLQDGAQQCAKFSKSSQSEGIKVLGQMVMDPTVTSEIRCEAITTACWLAPAMVGHRLLEWIGCQDLAVKKAALEALGTRAEILIRDPSFRRLFEEVRVDQVPSSTGGFEWGLPTDNSGELEALILATKHEDGEIRRLGSLALAELRALDTQHHRTH